MCPGCKVPVEKMHVSKSGRCNSSDCPAVRTLVGPERVGYQTSPYFAFTEIDENDTLIYLNDAGLRSVGGPAGGAFGPAPRLHPRQGPCTLLRHRMS
jgi:hypothetical protein